MRCETVVNDFQSILLEKMDIANLGKDLSIHLQNCNYCQKDCQKLLFDYDNQPNKKKEISQVASLQLKPIKINTFNQFTLLNYDPFLVKFLKEIERATLDFIDNPIGFIREVIDPVFEKQNSPYWDKSVRIATLIWLSSCVSIVLYGGFGWWWFPSNNVNSKNDELLTDSQKIYYISASLPYPPTYWTRTSNKINSNKTTLAINKSLATKTASKSKGSFAEPTNLEASLSTKNNSGISSTKTTTPEVRGNAFFASELKSSTDNSNIGTAKETKGSFVTGGRFVSSTTAQISATDTGEEDDIECCDYGNVPMCAEHKAMLKQGLNQQNSTAIQFGISSSSNGVSATSPNVTGGNQIRAFVAPETVSGGGMFSAGSESSIGNPNTIQSNPVRILVRKANVANYSELLSDPTKVGQPVFISIIAVGQNTVSNCSLELQFNPSVVRVTSVKDGGLMSMHGTMADFNHSISKNAVKINISRPANAKAVESFGQIALIYFEAIAPGSADFTLTDTQLLGTKGEPLPITLINKQVEIIKETK